MSTDRWTRISLRIASGTLKGREIELAIGATPETLVNEGEQISERSPAAGFHSKSMCIYSSTLPEEAALDEHVQWLCNFFTQHGENIEAIANQCELDVRIGFSSGSGQGAFAIPSESLAVMARFKADLLVDLYPPGDAEENEDG